MKLDRNGKQPSGRFTPSLQLPATPREPDRSSMNQQTHVLLYFPGRMVSGRSRSRFSTHQSVESCFPAEPAVSWW